MTTATDSASGRPLEESALPSNLQGPGRDPVLASRTPSSTRNPRLARYLTAVNGIGLVLALAFLATGDLSITPDLVILTLISALIAPHSVRIGVKMEMSAFQPFILTAMIRLGINPALLVSSVAMVVMGFTHRPRWEAFRFRFNLAAIIITTGVSGAVYQAAGGRVGHLALEREVPALMLATLTFFLANTLLVSAAVGLSTGAPVLQVWKEKYLWSIPSYFAGATFAMVLGKLVEIFGVYSLLLCLPLSVLIYFSYRLYVDKMIEKQRHLEDIQRMNVELERKVRERTDELEILNQRLKESNAELLRANNLKSEFLANMSHELRTPLNAIIGFSELLLEGGDGGLNASQREYVGDVLSSGRHLLELINDILDLSKIEAGKMALAVDDFDLAPVVEEAMITLRVDAARKGITLDAELDPALPGITADRGKFKQILTNLLSNAVKFTPPGGWVRVVTKGEGEWLQVSVADNGIGIRKEDQERIFAAFIQVDGSYARKYQGTGLGLTLVRRFVEMHGGTISVTSEVGKGSRFTFRIPVSPRVGEVGGKDLDSAAPGTTPRGGVPTGSLILVVEDNPANLKLTREILKTRGYRVLEATSGEEALDALKFIRPDLILMDIQLPGMDGLAVARQLKGDPATRDIPTVALTAYAMKRDEERARQAGCVGYIPKPIDTVSLPDRVAEYLRTAPHRSEWDFSKEAP